VTKLERGDVPLEESIAIYERGEALKQRCESLLREAEERVEKIRAVNGKAVGAEPFDAD
jgi:exodeoxyribonuclease VII small subunit